MAVTLTNIGIYIVKKFRKLVYCIFILLNTPLKGGLTYLLILKNTANCKQLIAFLFKVIGCRWDIKIDPLTVLR